MHPDHEKLLKSRKMTKEIKIEGVGIAREYGKLNLEKLVKRLLESEAIR